MATLGVILSARLQIVFPFLAAHKKLYQLLLESSVITLCATSFTLPITTYFFGNFSLLFLLANLIFPQLFTWYIYLSLASLLFPPLRTLVNLSTNALIWLLNKLAMIPGTLIPVRNVPLIILSVFLFLSVFLLLIWKGKRPLKLSAAALSFFLAFAIVLSAGVILSNADQQFLYYKGDTGDCIVAHHKGKTLLAVTNPSRWNTSNDTAVIMNGLNENDIDCLYFASYSSSLADAITRLSGKYLICQVVIPAPISEQEQAEVAKLTNVCDSLMIPIHLIPTNGTYEFEEFILTANGRSPLTERVDEVYFSFSIAVKDSCLTYLSRGYSLTPLYDCRVTPDLLIYGSYGENVPGYEHFRFTSAPDAIVLGDPDTPLLLSTEDKEMLTGTKTLQNIEKYSYPIQ